MASTPSSTERAIEAITSSRPPATDDLTYLTIVESHLSPEVLPTLNDVLQDVDLTQKIGWDLIHMLIPLPGAEPCLKTIARLGNPREVILQVTEALRLLRLDETTAEGGDDDVTEEKADKPSEADKPSKADEKAKAPQEGAASKPTEVDKFCNLVSMLATLHPRIKTKYPSRFLSTSLMAILSSYRPSNQATYAVIAFAHALSGQKRPPLPTRKSSLSMNNLSITSDEKDEQAPDPEASAEDPKEEAIQMKLLQSFVTHLLELYVKENTLSWSARLQEHFAPGLVIPGKKSFSEAFREDHGLQEREVVVGQIVALARDLNLDDSSFLLSILTAPEQEVPTTPPAESDSEDSSPSSPEEIPLSTIGCLFLLTSNIFSPLMFSNTTPSLPALTVFPTLSQLTNKFIGASGIETTGSENPSVIDAILFIGLFLEHSDKFVAGPLEDDEYLQLLQTLSLISANCPNPTLRYNAHVLTSNILHAHPTDRVRLTFISDTLEHCPFEPLRASAVGWLKEELILSAQRKSDNIFSSPAALSAVQPYLFPYESVMSGETLTVLWDDFKRTYPFHMAALNFLFFLNSGPYKKVVPEGSMSVIGEIYLAPLKGARERLEKALAEGGELREGLGEQEAAEGLREVQLLGERLDLCLE